MSETKETKPLWYRATGAVVGALVTAGMLSPQSPMNGWLCGQLVDHPKAAALACAKEQLKISDEMATEFIDDWAVRVRGSRREVSSWRVLSQGRDVSEPPADYVARWRKVVFLSRTDDIDRDDAELNVFTVPMTALYYRQGVERPDPLFSDDELGVDELTIRFDLTLDEKGRVTSQLPQVDDREAQPGVQRLVRVTAAVDTDYFDGPRRTAGPSNFAAGAHEMAVCQQDVDGQEWTYTHLGWVPNADLTTGGAPVEGLVTCPRPG